MVSCLQGAPCKTAITKRGAILECWHVNTDTVSWYSSLLFSAGQARTRMCVFLTNISEYLLCAHFLIRTDSGE